MKNVKQRFLHLCHHNYRNGVATVAQLRMKMMSQTLHSALCKVHRRCCIDTLMIQHELNDDDIRLV